MNNPVDSSYARVCSLLACLIFLGARASRAQNPVNQSTTILGSVLTGQATSEVQKLTLRDAINFLRQRSSPSCISGRLGPAATCNK